MCNFIIEDIWMEVWLIVQEILEFVFVSLERLIWVIRLQSVTKIC
jgi:hypothetical protein